MPSDFSFRDLPGFVPAFLVVSFLSVGLGLFIETAPAFLSGALIGGGGALALALLLFGPVDSAIDADLLPEPSEKVRALCASRDFSSIDAIKAYREETGLGLAEARIAVERCREASRPLRAA